MLVTEPKPIGKKSSRPAIRSFSSMVRNQVGNNTFKQFTSRKALFNFELSE